MSLELRCLVSSGVDAHGTRAVPLAGARLTIGSLASNSLALSGPGVEPLHCLLECDDDGTYRVIDLGALQGVRVNGHRIDVEAVVREGDILEIGSAKVQLAASRTVETFVRTVEDVKQVAGDELAAPLVSRRAQRLFKPSKSPGRYLEVVAYWGDTVLNVDHFHPTLRGMGEVTIGDPTKAHFQSGGRDYYKTRVLAEVDDQSYVLRLDPEMTARVRKNGHLRLVDGLQRMELGPRDYAHVAHGPIHYFLHFAEPPAVELPKAMNRDKLFSGLLATGLLLYVALVTVALVVTPKQIEVAHEDPWLPVYVDDPKPEPVRKQKEREIHIVEMRPEPLKAAAVDAPRKAVKTPPVKQAVRKEIPRQLAAVGKEIPNGSQARLGMTGAASSAPAGGSVRPATTPGSASGAPGAANVAAKGSTTPEPVKKTRSFVDLSKLGSGIGPVLNQPGGTPVPFRSSPGGMGSRANNGLKDYGLDGGVGGKRVGIAGSNDRANGFGPGSGLLGSGPGRGIKGSFGPGPGEGKGPGFGHTPGVSIYVPPQDIVTTSWDSSAEIRRVISSHLNEIRHCYEQLLQRTPQASGKLKVRFVIGLNGRVTTTNVVESTLSDTMFRSCVAGRVSRWAFQPLRGTEPLTVTYPFVFTPL